MLRSVDQGEEIIATCRRYGATNVRVFGSCARDDHHDKSDEDLMVDFKDGVDFFRLWDLQDSLEALLERKVDVGTESMLRLRVRESVLSELLIYE
jgi:hypothetical protein